MKGDADQGGERAGGCGSAGDVESAGPWFVYLLECADGSLYCGVTTELARRLAEHNGERPGGARYTKTRRPVRLAASASFPDRSSACKAEAKVKRLPRKDKLAFLRSLEHKPV